MKAFAVALVLLGLIAGCARHHSSFSSQSPSPSASPTDRPDLVHKSPSACEGAGRTWNHTAGVCM
jgi:hypothetical protein